MDKLVDKLMNKLPKLPCFYVNATSTIQIIRVKNETGIEFEKVVYPGESLHFQARPDDQLEVNTYECITSVLDDMIPCQRLCVAEQGLASSGSRTWPE